ncbi:hypothetical protein M0804_014485 [Polistes exclamans]|nr:hypothetical protein M0804_015172 [Polistes exclamans]KAI4475100.1 hypothetical protein M0804_014517 [Polistes exclamans]KAI4475148.1 hypothetical protein M0804_014485 [Polistes exclamans]
MVSILIALDGFLEYLAADQVDLLHRVSLISLAISLAMVGAKFSMEFDSFAGDNDWSGVVTEETITFGLNVS